MILVGKHPYTQVQFIDPPPKSPEIPILEFPRNVFDFNPEINTQFEENSPYQEGVISEMYQG